MIKKGDFGAKRIDKIKSSDVKGRLWHLDTNNMSMAAFHWEKYVQHVCA